MIPTIEALRAVGALSALDEHFARAMGRLGPEERPEVLLAAAATSRQVNKGDVCLDLRLLAGTPVVDDEQREIIAGCRWPALTRWRDVLQSSPLISDGNTATPLVLDGAGRLYLRRYWEHEARLAAALRVRATQVEEALDGPWLKAALDRLFPRDAAAAGNTEPDWQRIAALLALQRRLCVISGGPGTGKTFTVAKILALLVEQELHAGRKLPRATLVAPTGKAAARLAESIRKNKQALPCDDTVKQAIPEDAATIHRCLGSVAETATQFRHHAGNQLVTDIVLVDEASMVDLALMSRLVAAVPDRAHLILLGDKDQLASVEAGAVLGDICNTGAPRNYSRVLCEQVAALTGDRLPLGPDAPPLTGIWDCIVQLTHSYRYGSDSGIGALARAINDGDSASALDVLERAEFPDLTLAEPVGGHVPPALLRRAVLRGFRPLLGAGEPLERLRALERFRVLCAHRHGPDGVEEANRQIAEALADAGLTRSGGNFYSCEPIIVTRNDYRLGLFNGDVGLVADNPEGKGGKLAFFVGAGGKPRMLSPSRLPPHEAAFALTVHKSQGSEFDEVAVLLPEKISPVLTRELLYTAVTRARSKVTIHASRDVIEQAIARRIERASGLRDALWG